MVKNTQRKAFTTKDTKDTEEHKGEVRVLSEFRG